MSTLPNFLFVGSSKSGSTWVFNLLSWHPQVHVYPGKDLGFFTNEYDRGLKWYAGQFQGADGEPIIAEVAHSYMVSPQACERIQRDLPNARLMLCLREPVERTFSQYLDGLKNGKFSGTLREELEQTPSLIERSRYGTYVSKYLERFPREQIHIAAFDKLKVQPDVFAQDLFRFLGIDEIALPEKQQRKILPAGTPRVRGVAMAAKKLAKGLEAIGLAGLKGKAKRSPLVRNILYRPYTKATRPEISEVDKAHLREILAPEVAKLDQVAGTDFRALWGY